MKKNLLITLILMCTNLSAFANPDKIDMTKWQYNSAENVFYQLGIPYCDNPADINLEKLAVFVPANYMKCTSNGNETYSCIIDKKATMKNYTAKTAPIVMSIETPGYFSNPALTEYKSVWEYTNAGFIYVYPGLRGREHGAPAGVTDLKAAVKYVKYNKNIIPGNVNRIFSFGMSGGGAQSVILGASGDDKLYEPYLKQIGAIKGVSDKIYGAMAWCPITNLDSANLAYEWNLGMSRKDLDEESQKISKDMAEDFVKYINTKGFRDDTGKKLVLKESENGIYQSGSYYELLEKIVNQSLKNFLVDNLFPIDLKIYGKEEGFSDDFKIENTENKIEQIDKKNKISEEKPNEVKPSKTEKISDSSTGKLNEINLAFEYGKKDEAEREIKQEIQKEQKQNLIFKTDEEYINYLNSKKKWINYDPDTHTVKITNMNDFVNEMKPATKPVGAFDSLDRKQGENILFGLGDGKGLHFDKKTAELLKNTKYESEFASDFSKTDALGNNTETRMNMYNPLYYLVPGYKGYKTSNAAKYWRIRSGISQTDTALTTEVNLALALKKYCGKQNVDFETVWAMGHVKAERRGTPAENLVKWINKCTK